MAGILSKGITLGYSTSGASSYTNIPNLQQVPDLGGAADRVDVTTLADSNRKYINGIKDFGELAFTFLYDNSGASSNYRLVRALEDGNTLTYFECAFPDGTKFTFSGYCSTTINSAGVNDAMTFALNIALNSDITVTNPV